MPTQVSLTATEVLEAIQRTPRLTPIMIAQELKMNIGVVRNILMTVTNLGLVESPARGLYQITELGEGLLKDRKDKK